MANARVDQFVFEIATLASASARVDQFVFEIAVLPLGPTITCGAPPDGAVGTSYSHTFPVANGTLPLTFAITAGTLPTGVTLDATTGIVSGVPTLPGTFAFTIQVTDANLLASAVDCSITIIAAQVLTPQTIVGGGPPKFKGGCKRNNNWDFCIEDEIRRTRRITFPPSCSLPKEFQSSLPWEDDFGAVPFQAVPFNVQGSISTPLPAAGDQIVCTGKVPHGYDGLLTGIYQTIQGSPYDNGSGDILWRIQINQRYLLGLSNNPFALGSPQQPVPLTEGQILLSGQTFRYIVNVPNTGGSVSIPSRIVCGLLGFYWPR